MKKSPLSFLISAIKKNEVEREGGSRVKAMRAPEKSHCDSFPILKLAKLYPVIDRFL